MLKEHLICREVGGKLALRSVLSWFLVAVTRPPAWKRAGSGGLDPRIVPAFSQGPGAASESGRGRSGNKGQKGLAEPGRGHRLAWPEARCGERAPWRPRRAGCTSHLHRGLQFPKRPHSRRPASRLPPRRAGVWAGGRGSSRGEARGGAGRGRALGSLKARERSRERFRGCKRRPG